jgi:hypothetical protein
MKALHPEIDSSESFPSSHGSVFEALYCGRNNEQVDIKPGFAGTFITGGGKGGSAGLSDGITKRTSILIESAPNHSIHLPTPLETITEQKSFATLRSRTSFFSVRQKPSLPILQLRRGPTASTNGSGTARRKRSFSFDDLTFTRYRNRIFKSSTSTSDSIALADTTVNYPVLPKDDPPTRIPTPPGLPSFNTPAAASYRLPAPHVRLRDLVRGKRTPEVKQYRAQTSRLPPGALMRGPDGTIVRGRFRPPQSGHTGTVRYTSGERGLAGHPLHSAPRATVAVSSNPQLTIPNDVGNLLPGIRSPSPFNPSMATNTSLEGQDTLASGFYGQPGLLREPFITSIPTTPQVPPLSGQESRSKWVRFWEDCCMICCSAIKDEEGLLQPRLVPISLDGGLPEDTLRLRGAM